jgi:hypothetical protein
MPGSERLRERLTLSGVSAVPRGGVLARRTAAAWRIYAVGLSRGARRHSAYKAKSSGALLRPGRGRRAGPWPSPLEKSQTRWRECRRRRGRGRAGGRRGSVWVSQRILTAAPLCVGRATGGRQDDASQSSCEIVKDAGTHGRLASRSKDMKVEATEDKPTPPPVQHQATGADDIS